MRFTLRQEVQFISCNLRLVNRSRIRSLEHDASWLGETQHSNQGRRPIKGIEGVPRAGEESAFADPEGLSGSAKMESALKAGPILCNDRTALALTCNAGSPKCVES